MSLFMIGIQSFIFSQPPRYIVLSVCVLPGRFSFSASIIMPVRMHCLLAAAALFATVAWVASAFSACLTSITALATIAWAISSATFVSHDCILAVENEFAGNWIYLVDILVLLLTCKKHERLDWCALGRSFYTRSTNKPPPCCSRTSSSIESNMVNNDLLVE